MLKRWSFRAPFAYDADQVSAETGIDCGGESPTQQSFKEECDINVLVHRFGLTGQMPVNPVSPMWGDFTGVTDFRQALEQVRGAESVFMSLPAEVRARFQNNPGALFDFLADERNREEAVKLGLLEPQKPAVRSEGTGESAGASKGS